MKYFLVLLLALTAQRTFAWGTLGHMVVAQVAQNNLTPAAKKAVATVLKNQELVDVANWADSIKSKPEWVHTKPWHFVDIPDGEDYSTIEHSHDGDVVEAITDMVAVLKDPKSPAVEKENALKFIVHFVGDIHQPLHVGRPDDHGGNSLSIIFDGRKSNLHALWDTLMIMKQNMDHVQYAASLEAHAFMAPPYDIQEIPFSRIIAECMSSRKYIYAFKDASIDPVVLDAAYSSKNLALMNTQLLMGGKRLAILINSIYR